MNLSMFSIVDEPDPSLLSKATMVGKDLPIDFQLQSSVLYFWPRATLITYEVLQVAPLDEFQLNLCLPCTLIWLIGRINLLTQALCETPL